MDPTALALQRQLDLTTKSKLTWRRTTPNQAVHEADDRLFVLHRRRYENAEEVRYSEHRLVDGFVEPADILESSVGEHGHLVSALWGAAVAPAGSVARPYSQPAATTTPSLEMAVKQTLQALVRLEGRATPRSTSAGTKTLRSWVAGYRFPDITLEHVEADERLVLDRSIRALAEGRLPAGKPTSSTYILREEGRPAVYLPGSFLPGFIVRQTPKK